MCSVSEHKKIKCIYSLKNEYYSIRHKLDFIILRASEKPPSDEGGGFAVSEDGGREKYWYFLFSLPQSRCSRDSPLVRGGF